MCCDDETVAVLRRAGQKVTPQRLMVLTALRHRDGHATASEIFAQVRETYPYVDISTVYRTLASLKDLRLVTETDMGTGDLHYEWAGPTPHHHLICQRCQGVEELEHEHMERLGETLRDVYGFEANLDHFAIFGVCRACRTAPPAPPLAGEGSLAGT
jgi:Fur family transcriptional regulator, ferric uptake regulator